nr:uncharacterized protein LOC127310746 [Lolium perenne]
MEGSRERAGDHASPPHDTSLAAIAFGSVPSSLLLPSSSPCSGGRVPQPPRDISSNDHARDASPPTLLPPSTSSELPLLSLAGTAGSAVVLSTAVAPQPNPGAAPRPPTPGDKTLSARHDDDGIPCIEPLPVSSAAGMSYPSPGAAFLDSVLSLLHSMVATAVGGRSCERCRFWVTPGSLSPRFNAFSIANALNFNLTVHPDRFSISSHGGGVFSALAASPAVCSLILAHRSVRLGKSVFLLHCSAGDASDAAARLPPWPPAPAAPPLSARSTSSCLDEGRGSHAVGPVAPQAACTLREPLRGLVVGVGPTLSPTMPTLPRHEGEKSAFPSPTSLGQPSILGSPIPSSSISPDPCCHDPYPANPAAAAPLTDQDSSVAHPFPPLAIPSPRHVTPTPTSFSPTLARAPPRTGESAVAAAGYGRSGLPVCESAPPREVLSLGRAAASSVCSPLSYKDALLLSASPSPPRRSERLVFSPIKNHRLCFRCLSPEHGVGECRDPTKCAACGRSGHKKKACELPPLVFSRPAPDLCCLVSSPPSALPSSPPLSPRLLAALARPRSCSTSPPAARAVRALPASPMETRIDTFFHELEGRSSRFRQRPPVPFPRGAAVGVSPSSSELGTLRGATPSVPAVAPTHRGPPTFAPLQAPACTSASPAAATLSWSNHCADPLPRRDDVAKIFMPPPANDNSSHRVAYALVSPPSDSPGFLLRRAFEERGGNPFVGLAASDFGAMLVLFPSVEVREATLQLFPLYLMAMTSPWRSQRRGTTDYSALRLVIKLPAGRGVPPVLLMHD